MTGAAVPYEGAQEKPAWGDVQQKVVIAAEVAAAAAVALAMRGPHGIHTAMLVRQITDGLRDVSAQIAGLRRGEFSEAVVDEERRRAAQDALAAHGLLVPPQSPPRHLHSVS